MELPSQFPGNNQLEGYQRNFQARKRPRTLSDFGPFETQPNQGNEASNSVESSMETARLQELFNSLVGAPVLNSQATGNTENRVRSRGNMSRDFNLSTLLQPIQPPAPTQPNLTLGASTLSHYLSALGKAPSPNPILPPTTMATTQNIPTFPNNSQFLPQRLQRSSISSPLQVPMMGLLPPTNALTQNATTLTRSESNMFMLEHQPNEKQRKSYKRENRCLLPNPIVIMRRPNSRKIERGTVAVKLVYENKEELQLSKRILEGELIRSLDADGRANFSLRVSDTSEPRKFRLQFLVKYLLDGMLYEETILSHPFSVTSNKKKGSVSIPKLFDMKPRSGLSSEETEVWIKGRNFTERGSMAVKFGGKVARITETEDNLITCIVPPMEVDIDTAVEVTVSNFDPTMGEIVSDTPLKFTYLASKDKRQGNTTQHSVSKATEEVGSIPATALPKTARDTNPNEPVDKPNVDKIAMNSLPFPFTAPDSVPNQDELNFFEMMYSPT